MSLALLTDLYQLRMCYSYWKLRKHDRIATFELFFRKNPFHGNFAIFAGLEECLEFLETFRFTENDIKQLRAILPVEDGFFEYLRSVDGSNLTVCAMPDGSVAFPKEPLLSVTGPLGIAQLLESIFLNLVNFPSLICTNAARFRKRAGNNAILIEFGLRRAQGKDGAHTATKYAYMGGFDSTSNVLTALQLGIPVAGTQAHSFVCSFRSLEELDTQFLCSADKSICANFVTSVKAYLSKVLDLLQLDHSLPNEGELASFIAYAQTWPEEFCVLLDTYDTVLSGTPNFIACCLALSDLGYQAKGVRIDSGSLPTLSLKVHEMIQAVAEATDRHAFEQVKILVSDNVNEETLRRHSEVQHHIDGYGIGTNLVTCEAQPALGCVYKLVAMNGEPRIKLSQTPEKVSIPCRKKVYRLHRDDGSVIADCMFEFDEEPPQPLRRLYCRHPHKESQKYTISATTVTELSKVVWQNGARVETPKKLLDNRENVKKSLSSIDDASEYKVLLSEQLYQTFHRLWNQEMPIPELG